MKIPLWVLRSTLRKFAEEVGVEHFSKPAFGDIHRKLLQRLPGKGTFVEAGAVDGVFESNTYYLERFCGWTGVLVEPDPAMYHRLAFNRPGSIHYNCALVSDEFQGDCLSLFSSHALSSVRHGGDESIHSEQVVQVQARTLTSVLECAGVQQVDFFSLDVEGYEWEVLRGLDFRRFRPNFLLIEFLEPAGRRKIEPWLLEEGMKFVDQLTYRDFLYSAV